jgi:DNA invertase Pin-like site-specific DNA recombinase
MSEQRVIGYCRVSTRAQGEDGLGMDAQVAAVLARYPEAVIVREVGSGARADGRPKFCAAVARMRAGDTLVTSKVDRLGRSAVDVVLLGERAVREGWSMVALDLGLDTSTPMGEFALTIFAAAARLERRLIGQRTRDALAVKREDGWVPDPVRRWPVWAEEWVCRVVEAEGSVAAGARRLGLARTHVRRVVART